MRYTLSAPAGNWDASNDWSASSLDGKMTIRPRMPVYDAGKPAEGDEPPGIAKRP